MVSATKRASRLWHFDDGALVLVGIEEDVVALAHQAMEEAGKFRQPVDVLDAGSRLRLLLVEFVAFPAFVFGRGLAQEETVRASFRRPRRGKGRRMVCFLFDAGEIEEIGVGGHGGGAVAVGGGNVVGVEDSEGIGAAAIGAGAGGWR